MAERFDVPGGGPIGGGPIGGTPSVNAYTLTAESGSYAVNGSTVGLRAARRLSAASGSYAVTGDAVTLTHEAAGEFALEAEAGAYALTGATAGLRAGRRLTMGAGAYALSGAAVALHAGRRLAMAAGSYALSGAAVPLRHGYPLVAGAGSYAVTGGAVGLRAARKLSAAAGAYAVTGTAVTFTLGSVGPRLTMGPGVYALFGRDVNLRGPAGLAGYASFDLDAFDAPFEGRLENGDELVIERTLPDVFFADVAEPRVTLAFSNRDGVMTPAYATARGALLELSRYDVVSASLISKLRAAVVWPKLPEHSFEVDCAVIDRGAYEQLIPEPTVDTATWPNAVDVGETIPVIFGNCPDQPLLYVNDDRVGGFFDYLVGHGSLAVTALARNVPGSEVSKFKSIQFSECVRAAGGAATSWSEVARTDLYAGYTVVRFIKRQGINANADSGLHTIYADVTGLQTERNFVQAGATVLGNTTWGLGRAVNAASVTAAAALLPAGLVCDGAMRSPRRAREVLGDLFMVRGIRPELNAAGEITLQVDQSRNQIALAISDDNVDGPRNRVQSGVRSGANPEERVKDYVLRYRLDAITGEPRFKARRTVNAGDAGRNEKKVHPFIRDHVTADMVADYIAKKMRTGQESIEVTVTQDGRELAVGDLVQFTKASQGYDEAVLEVRKIAERLTTVALTLQGYHWSTYVYEPGTLPADASSGTETDLSRTAPSSATFVFLSSGSDVGNDGHVTARVRYTIGLPTSNTDHANVLYKLAGAADWSIGAVAQPGDATARISGLLPGTSYDFGIQVVNVFGLLSSVTTDLARTTPTDSSVPGTPSAPTVSSPKPGIHVIIDAGTRPTDFAEVIIYSNTSNTSAGATEVTRTRSRTFIDHTQSYGAQRWYFLKYVDLSGNVSASFSSSGTSGSGGAPKVQGSGGNADVDTGSVGVGTTNIAASAVSAVTRNTGGSFTTDASNGFETAFTGSSLSVPSGSNVLVFVSATCDIACKYRVNHAGGALFITETFNAGERADLVWVDDAPSATETYSLDADTFTLGAGNITRISIQAVVIKR